MRAQKFIIMLFAFSITAPCWSADVVGGLLKDSVATFSDSYDLIYYSLRSALAREAKEQNNSVKSEAAMTDARILKYLVDKGIVAKRDQQPISRADFARIIIQRFDLPRGFFTKLLDSPSWYFRDAVRAGLFSESDQGESTMSTREMLSVFTRAESLSRAR